MSFNMYRDATCGPEWGVKHRRKKMFIRATTVRVSKASALPRLTRRVMITWREESRDVNRDARYTYKIINNEPIHMLDHHQNVSSHYIKKDNKST